jgi:imidazolonepropionase-like amidohydrolase
MARLVKILVFLFLPFFGRSQDKPLVLTHVTVVDVLTGNLSKDVFVTISGGRITKISPQEPVDRNARFIDARGKYLIPGLWDMHVHLSFYGEEALSLLVANGVTGVRDMGGDLDQLNRWRSDIVSGRRLGPRITRAGPFIDGPKKMSAIRAPLTRIVTTAGEARLLVDSLKEAGVDYLKVHSRLPRTAFFALAEEAHKRNIPFAVHLPKDVKPEEASDAGARSIEHTESLLGDIIYETQEEVREKRTDSALNVLYGDAGYRLAAHIAANKNFYDPTLISLYRIKGTSYEATLGPRLMPVLRQLYLAHVQLLTGSDFATKEAGIRPGVDLHGELVLFVKAGMKPVEALQAATINPARCLYLDDSLGTVEEGKIADLVLLDDNPLTDIANTKKIHAVILGGRYLPE